MIGGMDRLSIEYLEDRPEVIPAIARWVWQEWGFASVEACAGHLVESHRGALPSRFVAIVAKEPVGIVNLIECNLPPRCHLTPWLAGLFVHPEHRDRGVGTALTRFCEAEAAALGVRTLYLYTERAEGFYQRRGWTTLESLEWEGEPVTVMSRELQAHTQES
jgi:GNAT superfamily N-acetyltransferase